jgi:hypothetical protein
MARLIKKAKRVRIQGTDTRLEIQYVVDSIEVRVDRSGTIKRTAVKGWVDTDGIAVEVVGNGKFRRTSDGTILIAEE